MDIIKKIAILSEQDQYLLSWAEALSAKTHEPRLLHEIKDHEIVMLKLKPQNFNLAKKIKHSFPNIKIIGIPEGALNTPDNDYKNRTRLDFCKACQEVDALGVPVLESQDYFKLITDKPVFWLGSPFPVDWSKQYLAPPDKKEIIIEMQNSFCRKKGGMANFFLLKTIQKQHPEAIGKTYSREIGIDRKIAKKIGLNLRIEPNLNWKDYFVDHSKAYIAIHMDYFWSWNQYSVECAAAGIPCISPPYSTTQKILFPKLCVEPFDFDKANNLAARLLRDKDFYNSCREHALQNISFFNIENSVKRLLSFIKEEKWI